MDAPERRDRHRNVRRLGDRSSRSGHDSGSDGMSLDSDSEEPEEYSQEQLTRRLCRQLADFDHRSSSSARDSSSSENDKDTDDEGLPPEEYGYVGAGSRLKGDRYLVMERVGSGHFSAVFLAFDEQGDLPVAIKVQRSAKHYIEAARDEIDILDHLGVGDKFNEQAVVRLRDSFDLTLRPSGAPKSKRVHVCMVFDVLGRTALSLIKRCHYRGAPLLLVKIISRRILEALHYIHSRKVIHTDLKPENIMFRLSPKQTAAVLERTKRVVRQRSAKAVSGGAADDGNARTDTAAPAVMSFSPEENDEQFALGEVRIIDFGNACWTFRHFASSIQTREYRGPEVILDAGYDTTADVWSAACVIFELLTGEYLFHPRSGGDAYGRDDHHLSLIIKIVGPMSQSLLAVSKKRRKFFDRRGELRRIRDVQYTGLANLLYRKDRFPWDVCKSVAQFLRPMLEINPKQRCSAKDCLHSPFLRIEDPRRDGLYWRRHERRWSHVRKGPKRTKYQRAYQRLFS